MSWGPLLAACVVGAASVGAVSVVGHLIDRANRRARERPERRDPTDSAGADRP